MPSRVQQCKQLSDGVHAFVPNLLDQQYIVALHDLRGDKEERGRIKRKKKQKERKKFRRNEEVRKTEEIEERQKYRHYSERA